MIGASVNIFPQSSSKIPSPLRVGRQRPVPDVDGLVLERPRGAGGAQRVAGQVQLAEVAHHAPVVRLGAQHVHVGLERQGFHGAMDKNWQLGERLLVLGVCRKSLSFAL